MKRRFIFALSAAMVGAAACCLADAANKASEAWPQWLGPHRTGVTGEAIGSGDWQPRQLWSADVGDGCTSPILADGRVYVMGWASPGDAAGGGKRPKGGDGVDTVYCFDGAGGKELWRQSYPCPYQPRTKAGDEGQYGGPSSTPALDPATGYLYTLSIDGNLHCWDVAKGGAKVWSKDLAEEYKVAQRPNVGKGLRDFGFTSSPLIVDQMVVVEVGSKEGTVMAFDKLTGQRRWASALKGSAGHSSGPVKLTVQGALCIATLTLEGLVVMRADTGQEGKTVAQYAWKTDYACNIATPAASGNRILITSGYNHRKAALLEVSLSGVKQVWTSQAYATVSSPVIHKDDVFLVDNALQCIDLASGKPKWKGGSFGHGTCLVTADGKLLVLGNGNLVLADAGADAYQELGRVKGVLKGTCYPHVVLAEGMIVCKDRHGKMVCLSSR